MASPFSTFRKRQKTWMAVLGVLCMFVFVFGSTQCAGPGNGPVRNAVVASTKYGDIHEAELYEMRVTAATVDRFLEALVSRTTLAIVQEQTSLAQFQQQLAMQMYNNLVNQGMIMGGQESQISEVALVDLMLLEQRAKQNGLIVSDEAINAFLQQITQENLSRDDLVAITNEMKIDPRRLFDGLRRRLMAQRVRQMFVMGLGLMNAPPAEKWEYYLRLNQRARAQIVPVKVSDFVDQVKTPDDATISKFFEEHKDEIHQPGSPEPGFKQPHQVALQYFKADYEEFLDEGAVTAEEIEAHYEKFKDTRYLFTDPPETPVDEPAADEPPADADKSDATKPSDAPKTDEPMADDAKADPQAVKKEDAKATEKEAEKKPAEPEAKPAGDAAKPDTAKPGADPAADKPADADKQPADASEEKPNDAADESQQSDESSCDAGETEADANADADAKSDDAAADKPAADEPANKPAEKKPAETKSAEATPADAKPAAEAKPADAKPADETAAADAEKPAESEEPSLLELSSELSLPQNIRDGVRPKYNPLWRVEKDIRRELAGEKAAEKMQDAFREIRPVLNAYYDTFNAWKADHPDLKGDAEHPRPPRPDFAALAEKHGLTAHETGLLSLFEIATDTDIGQAVAQVGQGLQNPGYVHAVLAMSPLYRAADVQDQDGNLYLYWKVNNVEEHVPELDDEGIRQQVVSVWKEIQARDLAQKRAEELAKQASDGKPLAELVEGQPALQLIETQPFTWMTAGSPFLGPSAPQMTSVPGVEAPGPDFMSTVFGLEEGETGVAFNAPKTVAYAVKVTSLEPSLAVLRETFAVETPRQNQNYFMLAQADSREASQKWMTDLREDAGLHWTAAAADLNLRD